MQSEVYNSLQVSLTHTGLARSAQMSINRNINAELELSH